MAYEKRLRAVPSQLFTADGTTTGKITVFDASLFKVKQLVNINATGQPTLNIQVKRIDDITTIYVGDPNKNIDDRTDVSAYTVALGATINADEQQRPNIPEEQVTKATYEEEPVVARRSILVDKLGNKIDDQNPLPVASSPAQTADDIILDYDPGTNNLIKVTYKSRGVTVQVKDLTYDPSTNNLIEVKDE